MKHPAVYVLSTVATLWLAASVHAADIPITNFGAIGDGITDDTVNVQAALTACSNSGDRCIVPPGKTFVITNRLFLWGASGIYCTNRSDGFRLNGTGVNLINLGISALLASAQVWSGTLEHCTYTVTGQQGNGGRILFFWRTDGATIKDNLFSVGPYAYGATSSGNNNAYLAGCEANAYSPTNPCIRRNLTITNNEVLATADNIGSEGFGLGLFDSARITENDIVGVGDDPVGIHFSTNIQVTNNRMSSTDGRLFISNSRHILVAGNHISRMARVSDGRFFTGIALIYVGFELETTNGFSAPVNNTVLSNTLVYPLGSRDLGSAIYLYGIRESYVAYNRIYNYSLTQPTVRGIYVLPFPFSGTWTDPDAIDPTNIARVHTNLIHNNNSNYGTVPLSMIMTGNCVDYVGRLSLQGNTASSLSYYCGFANTGVYEQVSGDIATGRPSRQ